MHPAIVRAVVATAAVLAALTFAPPLHADPPGWTITQLTDDDFNDYSPRVSGSSVAWSGHDGDDYEIYLYNGTTTTQISNNAYADWNVQVSGSNATWCATDGSTYWVYYYDGATTRQIADNLAYWDEFPQISGSNVVWHGDDHHVYFYDGTTTTQLPDTGTGVSDPRISGSNVVWFAYDAESDAYEIFLHDGTTLIQLTDNDVDDWYPQVSGLNIAWEGWDGDSYEIFFCDGDTVRKISDGNYPGLGNGPGLFHLSGSSVVWASRATGDIDSEIFLFDGTTVRQLTDNDWDDYGARVSGPNVVWHGDLTAVCFFDGTSTTELMPGGPDGWNSDVDIDGSTVVWIRETPDGRQEVFMAQPIPEPATLWLLAVAGFALRRKLRRP